jgi:acyl-coenzyme A synthetase/AMP-(fatty) acid ligase/D-alanine-D-alanine ligase-like ATP-grasp enzyme
MRRGFNDRQEGLVMTEAMNMSSEFFRNAASHPESTAITCISGDVAQAITYGELASEVAAAMRHFGADGVASGSCVAYSVRDSVSDLVNFIALTALGVGIFPVAAANGVERSVLDRLGISKLVADHDDLRAAALAKVAAWHRHPRSRSNREAQDELPDCSGRPWIVRSSSGTTGSPKTFVTSHDDGVSRRQRYFAAVPNRNRGFYSFTPIRFGAARQRHFYELSRGNSVYFMEEQGALEAKIGNINLHGIANLYCVPMYLELLCDQARRKGVRGDARLFPHEPLLEATSSPVTSELREKVEQTVSSCLVNCYAVSEVGHISSTIGLGDFASGSSDIGLPLEGIEVGILDDAGQPMPTGEIGQMAVRFTDYEGSVVYLDESGARISPMRDGWFITGDLGRLVEGGRMVFMGRADDLIIFNGMNIFPSEIERSALSVPGVRDACAFGVPSRVHHLIPHVAIIPDPGFDEQAFMQSMRAKLGPRSPVRSVVVPEFPRNAMGKVLRAQLAEVLDSRLLSEAVVSRCDPGGPATCSGDWWTPRTRIAIDVSIPKAFDAAGYGDWAQTMIERRSWLPEGQSSPVPLLEGDERTFMESLVVLSCAIFNLGGIPVFQDQVALSVSRAQDGHGRLRLDLEFPFIDFIPASAYKLVFTRARDFCHWMAVNRATQKGLDALFEAMETKMIGPLRKLVPASKSTMPVLNVAKGLGIPFTHLGLGIYQLGWGSKGRRLDGSRSGLDSAIGAKLSQNKVATADLLRMAGLPAPVHGVASDEQQAIALAGRIGFPLVVKPVDMDRGEGVSVDIGDAKALSSAFSVARDASKSRKVIVERQVPGVCHRLFVAGGKLLYGVKRLPISVRGDGSRTVRQLVADEVDAQARMAPWRRSGMLPLDELALDALHSAGLSPDSIPGESVLAPLRRIESTEWGGVDEEVTHGIHPDNLAAAIEATRLLGLDFAGVDIISPDISRSWVENGAIINEVNFSPLLGGGEISRSHIGELLDDIVEGDGRIPVDRFNDGEAAANGRARYLGEGARCFYVDGERTVDHAGREIAMPFGEVERRIRALLLRPDVDAIVVCVPD